MAGAKKTVNILIVSLNVDTQGNRCLLVLDDDDLSVNQWWFVMPPGETFGPRQTGTWVYSAVASRIQSSTVPNWILNKVSNPMTVGQRELGRHECSGKYIGYGDIAWKCISINVVATNWENVEFDVSEVTAAQDSDDDSSDSSDG